MTIQFGNPISLEEFDLPHALQHPIWVWAWEAGKEGEVNEDWLCPVIGTTDVTAEFTEPVITVKVQGTDIYGTGSYNCELDQLEAISLLENGTWTIIQETALPTPIILTAVPTIDGVTGVKFSCQNPSSDRAPREG